MIYPQSSRTSLQAFPSKCYLTAEMWEEICIFTHRLPERSSIYNIFSLQGVLASKHRTLIDCWFSPAPFPAFHCSMWSRFLLTLSIYVTCYFKQQPTPDVHTDTPTHNLIIWPILAQAAAGKRHLLTRHITFVSNPLVKQTVDIIIDIGHYCKLQIMLTLDYWCQSKTP